MQKTINNILFSQFISIIYYAAKTTVQKNHSYYNKNNYYVFLVNKSEKGDKNGIMPFNRHFGFIFMENSQQLKANSQKLYHTIAHELAHGAFTLYHTFSTKDKGITKGSTYNLMDYTTKQPNNLLRKYQWYVIHNPRLSLFGGAEEEVSSEVVLESSYELQSYFGHEKILAYLLDEGADRMLEEINIYRPTKENPFGAKQIIESALGAGTIVGDEEEAKLLLDEFHHLYLAKAMFFKNDELFSSAQLTENSEFPEEEIYNQVKMLMGYSESTIQSFSIFMESLAERWEIAKSIDFAELNGFKKDLIRSLNSTNPSLEITSEGMTEILKRISNQQIKKLYKTKIPDVSHRTIKNIIWSRNNGVHDYKDLVKVLKQEDMLKAINSFDDITLASIRTASNFKNLMGNPLLKLSNNLEGVGNAINLAILIYSVEHNLKISPMDILAVFPHPISISVLIAQPIMNDYEKKVTEMVRAGETYQTVKCWNKTNDNGEPVSCSLKGKHQNKDEWLYVCYTNQKTIYNPDLLPTSIIFTNKVLANKVFGFAPSYCDFGYKSRIENSDNSYTFIPNRQVEIKW